MRPIFGAAYLVVVMCAFGASFVAHGEPLRAVAPVEAANPLKVLIPGEEFLPAAVRAQGADDFDSPAYSFVEAGEAVWSKVEGDAGKSCQSCHGTGERITVKRAAAAYPKYSPVMREVVTLQTQINLCRQGNLGAPKLPDDDPQMLALTAFLRWLSRGSPSTVSITGTNTQAFERGRKLYHTKVGLFQISCDQCHDGKFGQKFGADILSQGHPLAYPAYKTSEGRLISLHERFRMCNRLARAEGEPDNAPNYVALELYINWRSKNLPVTAPGVRP